ncbi:MAG: hypothetical protein CL489_09225 [Acidobacteria bacterium]|nr:hypothetical protein [Acidobacteriota bacterium]|tara:strand:+ start:517 stop:1002 length:486 start_codon:yes stop_codon:yes gene_type:complete
MAYKGKFRPTNIGKYKGNWKKIQYRSLWELHIMKWCDRNNDVIKWSSEEVVIPYYSSQDNKKRRYFMDFYVKMRNGNEFLFEVKPEKETHKPKKPSRMTTKAKERFIKEDYTWKVNNDKWKTAHKLCEKRGWKFKIITEKALQSIFGYKGINNGNIRRRKQ